MSKYQVDDIVMLKKPHPCGVNEWKILRTGVDIKLLCTGCQKQVWLTRPEFEKRLRRIKDSNGKFISILNFQRENIE